MNPLSGSAGPVSFPISPPSSVQTTATSASPSTREPGRIIIVSVIDNLIKGASGQAIQNMNLMCGLEEETGLPAIALFP